MQTTLLNAQQEQQVSQASQLKYLLNPAYGGLDYSLSIDAMVRSQWSGLAGAPKMQYLGFNIPTYAISGAMGGELSRFSEGALTHVKITGSYNYVSSWSFGFLSFGGRAGLLSTRLDGDKLITATGIYSDGQIVHNDPLLAPESVNSIAPYLQLGAYLYSTNTQMGVSIARIPNLAQRIGSASISHELHSTIFAEYRFEYSDLISFLPSILLKSDFNSLQSDVSLQANINGNIFGGIGIRGYNGSSIDALVFTAGMKLGDHYRLSYSYDAGISSLRKVNEGSHEILLNYNLRKLIGISSAPKVEYNPRNL